MPLSHYPHSHLFLPLSARPVVNTYVEVIVNVLIVHLWAVKELLWVLVRLLLVPRPPKSSAAKPLTVSDPIEEELKRRKEHDVMFSDTHHVLNAVLKRIPGAKHHLIPMLEK